ncbi:hypothetical protein BJ170DRAFT_710969 [Xylariales sp. AK1849]|nr:hypothetical protein BJ170DRAFT_710969 [Xylariales sp. AK1849]
MKLLGYLTTLFAAFLVLVTADTENYQVFKAAADSSGVAVNGVNRFAFYEYWHSTGSFRDCIVGWSHVRVIVGKRYGTAGNYDFRATAFDMVIGEDGRSVEPEQEPWLANSYIKNGAWVRVSQNSQYSGAHKVKTGYPDNEIANVGNGYCRDYPTYSFTRNSCLNYANFLMNKLAES